MERTLFIRRALAATLTAAAALAAHGGPAVMLDPRWTIVAGATALGVTALGAAAARYLRACTSAPEPPAVWVTAGVLLVAQMAAHCVLLLTGVHSGVGVAGALALHASLALVVAIVIHATDTWLEGQLTALARALTESLQAAVLHIPAAPAIPRLWLHAAAAPPRAPPARA